MKSKEKKRKEKKSKISVCTSIILVYYNKHDQNHLIIIFFINDKSNGWKHIVEYFFLLIEKQGHSGAVKIIKGN